MVREEREELEVLEVLELLDELAVPELLVELEGVAVLVLVVPVLRVLFSTSVRS